MIPNTPCLSFSFPFLLLAVFGVCRSAAKSDKLLGPHPHGHAYTRGEDETVICSLNGEGRAEVFQLPAFSDERNPFRTREEWNQVQKKAGRPTILE